MVDEGTSSNGGDVTLDPPAPVRNRRRTALWGVLAAVAVAAGALAVTSGGDDGGPSRLPVALGSSAGAANREAAMAADMSMAAWVTYVAGDGLPALGGDAPAYRVDGTVDRDTVQALAGALGMEGEPSEEDGYWHLESGDAALDVYEGGGGAWSYWVDQGGDVAVGSGSSGSSAPGVDCSTVDPSGCAGVTTTAPAPADAPASSACEPGTKCVEPTAPITSPCPPDAMCTLPVEECPPNADCAQPMPVEPVPAPDLPTEDEARRIALDLLTATGMDVDGAKVTVDGPYDAWYVNVEPTVDGVPVSGWYSAVSVGPMGAVLNASGILASVESLGDYPTIETPAAVDRLNEQQGGPYAPMGRLESSTDDATTSDVGSGSAPAVGTSDGATPTAGSATEPAPDTECKVQPDGREICEPVLPTEPCTPIDVVDPPAGEEVPAIGRCMEPPICELLVAPSVEAAPGSDPVTETTALPQECGEWAPYPIEEPEPIEVVLTDAARILVLLPALDGSSDGYLVPGYRFGGEDGTVVDVAAVADEALAPTTTVPAPDPPQTEPAPLPTDDCEVLVEEDASGTTHTMNPCNPIPPGEADPIVLGDGETPELGVAYHVDGLNTHCGVFTWAGQWWATDAQTPLPWSTPTEGGSFTLTTPEEGTFVGDAAGTKVETFTARGPAGDVPGCA